MKTKICGITNLQDALFCIQAGAWAIGFNFYPPSPRYITMHEAKNIIAQLPASIVTIGIFIEQNLKTISILMDDIELDFAQVYKDDNTIETRLKKKMLLCLQPETLDEIYPEALQQYAYILIDAPRHAHGLYGGTGQKAQWNVARAIAKDYHVILAGGLQADNVQQAIQAVQPFAVDVASGTECTPGIKDRTLINSFLSEVNNAC